MILIIVVLVALPIAAIAFALGAGQRSAADRQGAVRDRAGLPRRARGGPVGAVSAEVREEEIRQMVEARSDPTGAKARGEAPSTSRRRSRSCSRPTRAAGPAAPTAALREEVRQLVVARNERRLRRGEEPLDVEAEIERQLRELENLGQ